MNAQSGLQMPSLSQQLHDNLQAQHDCATELLSVLKDEHSALLAADVAKLEHVTRIKADAAGRLAQLGSTLNRLRGKQNLDTLLAGLPVSAPSRLWQQLRGLAGDCQRANQDNAVLLAARESQLRQTLRALRPADTPEIYGRGGRSGLGLAARRFGAA